MSVIRITICGRKFYMYVLVWTLLFFLPELPSTHLLRIGQVYFAAIFYALITTLDIMQCAVPPPVLRAELEAIAPEFPF